MQYTDTSSPQSGAGREVFRKMTRTLDYAGNLPIAVGVFGQSVELGSVLATDQAGYPQAFQSQKNPAMFSPGGPATGAGGRGGFWMGVHDELYDWGYDLRLVNGALGSLSFTQDAAGQVLFRQNNGAVRARRLPGAGNGGNGGDRGYYGDVLVSNGRVFVCTTGRQVAAFSDGPFRINAGQTNLDYRETVGTEATAGSAPDFSTATVGATVTDGTVVWTCVSTDAAGLGLTNGTIMGESNKGFGFDPFGAMARLHEQMQQVHGVYRKIIYISNGQSDISATTAWYRDALVSIGNYFLVRGYEIMVGLTTWFPLSTVAAYNNLKQGRIDALTILRATVNGAKVYDGADLYTLMGVTGPMGGWRGVATIASGVMTVASTSNGAGIEVGQTITNNATTPATLGTVTGIGTYTAASGVGTVTVSAADQASNTFRTLGDFIYPSDGTHLNGRGNVGPALNGVSPIKTHVSEAFKAILPQRA